MNLELFARFFAKCLSCQRASLSLEFALFIGAAMLIAAVVLPLLVAQLGGYAQGFTD